MTYTGRSVAGESDPDDNGRDEAALLAALIEAAPRPSVAFRARLRAELRAERAARRTAGWPAAFRQLFSVNGGLDMKGRMGMVVAVGLLRPAAGPDRVAGRLRAARSGHRARPVADVLPVL